MFFVQIFLGGSIYFPVFFEENNIYLDEQAATSTHRKCYSTVSRSTESHGLQLSNNPTYGQKYAVGDEAEVDKNRSINHTSIRTSACCIMEQLSTPVPVGRIRI